MLDGQWTKRERYNSQTFKPLERTLDELKQGRQPRSALETT